ncbi:MAG: hypothetical protein LBC44_04215 [Mycoplasmataceae bacterium]|jgi:hypothetical protein|nr:hypothetical protein [Mycoplasmataceae bacterium]
MASKKVVKSTKKAPAKKAPVVSKPAAKVVAKAKPVAKAPVKVLPAAKKPVAKEVSKNSKYPLVTVQYMDRFNTSLAAAQKILNDLYETAKPTKSELNDVKIIHADLIVKLEAEIAKLRKAASAKK